MRSDLTDITVVMDRSGSMQMCREDAEGGLNAFVEEQKKAPGQALFTLVQFDTEYEFVHKGVPIKDVPAFKLVPRGNTALYDAIGRALNETGDRLAAMPEDQRPGLVVFVILTDGQENSSREFNGAKIKEMVSLQEGTYGWKFTYLGANQDAFAAARDMAIPTSGVANFAASSSKQAYRAASANVMRMRHAVSTGATADCAYTDEERKAMS